MKKILKMVLIFTMVFTLGAAPVISIATAPTETVYAITKSKKKKVKVKKSNIKANKAKSSVSGSSLRG